MTTQNIIDYTILTGNTCYKFNDFIKEVNMYVGNGYKPYGKLITHNESNKNSCIIMIQPMIKYGPANTTE